VRTVVHALVERHSTRRSSRAGPTCRDRCRRRVRALVAAPKVVLAGALPALLPSETGRGVTALRLFGLPADSEPRPGSCHGSTLPAKASARHGFRTPDFGSHGKRQLKHYHFTSGRSMWSSTWNVLDDARSTWNLPATLASTPPDELDRRDPRPRQPGSTTSVSLHHISQPPPAQSAFPWHSPISQRSHSTAFRHHTPAYLNPCRPRVAT
jgi:hypothetical protein